MRDSLLCGLFAQGREPRQSHWGDLYLALKDHTVTGEHDLAWMETTSSRRRVEVLVFVFGGTARLARAAKVRWAAEIATKWKSKFLLIITISATTSGETVQPTLNFGGHISQ